MGDEALHEHPDVGVDVDEAVTGAGYVVLHVRVLEGVGDQDPAADLGDVERGVPGRQVRVTVEVADYHHAPEGPVEDVDPVVVEVRREQQRPDRGVGQGQALVHGTGGVGD